MKKFKFGNPPAFVVRDPIKKTRQTDLAQADKTISPPAASQQIMKTPNERIKSNFGFVDIKSRSVDTKISSSNSVVDSSPAHETKTAGYQTQQTKEIEEKINFSTDPDVYTKKAVARPGRRRVVTRVTSQQSIVNGPGGWKI